MHEIRGALCDPRLWLSKAGAIVREAGFRLFGVSFEQYFAALEQTILDGGCQSLLDIGCGERSPISRFSKAIPRTTGVDSHLPSIENSKAEGIHTDYVQMNIAEIGSRFAASSFDCVVALEVIEHFEKDDGLRLLDAMETIAAKKVVVFTPNGFLAQPATPDNPHQLHCSGSRPPRRCARPRLRGSRNRRLAAPSRRVRSAAHPPFLAHGTTLTADGAVFRVAAGTCISASLHKEDLTCEGGCPEKRCSQSRWWS